ncbi:MAG: hypothetical protein EA383_04325 [Spirochaetaceae bacterium]|nr:MAG: hypothetical protein EA383_04325 [Spirochaetaceae bacterium]
MRYEASWNSIRKHELPQWFRDAKFGIYAHWGIYSVPGCGPNGTWYPYNMYRPGTPQYEHHCRTYGPPTKFGYKDFIPMFTAERFDADEWAGIFKDAGAVFSGPVAEHHDGFSMWDSSVNEWNCARMGPKRDVTGELAQAIRAQGMRFMVALHHAENWWFFNHNDSYDTTDPRFAGLYGEPHDVNRSLDELPHDWTRLTRPSRAFLDQWFAKVREVIDGYRPDLMWFDVGIGHIQEHYKREFLSSYYNAAVEWDTEVVVTYKHHDLVPGSGLVDLELGRFNEMTYNEWITDTTVDSGEGWCYLHDNTYKDATEVLHYLIDNVSKNGHLLLNVDPRPDGTIPEPSQHILREMGSWLRLNGEAIYGTTPWMAYGEGPTLMQTSGGFTESEKLAYTASDFRFTVNGDVLYAIALAWPAREAVIRTVWEKLYPDEIVRITMPGVDGELRWTLDDSARALKIETPKRPPCEHAYVFRIERRRPFEGRSR